MLHTSLSTLLAATSALAQCPTGNWTAPSSGTSGVQVMLVPESSEFDGRRYRAVAWDPDGPGPLVERLAVSGRYSRLSGTVTSNPAVWTGLSWQPIPTPNSTFEVHAVWNGQVVLTSLWDNRVLTWNGQSLSQVGTLPAFVGVTEAIVWNDALVIATDDGVFRWDGTAWQRLGGQGGTYRELTVHDGRLFRLGWPAFAVEEYRPQQNQWGGAGSNAVGDWTSLASHNGVLYVAGSDGVGLRRLVGTTWQQFGFPILKDMISGPDGLYAVGEVGTFFGMSRFDGTAWQPIRNAPINPDQTTTLFRYQGGVGVVGGAGLEDFQGLGYTFSSRPLLYLQRADVVSMFNSGLNSVIRGSARFRNQTVFAGRFNTSDDSLLNGLATWDTQRWQPLDNQPGRESGITAVATFQGDLFAAGEWTTPQGLRIDGLGRWNGSTWTRVGNNPGVDELGTVLAMKTIGDSLYLLGGVNGNIARYDGAFIVPLGAQGAGGVNDTALAIDAFGGEVYVGGRFTAAGGQPASRVARWNGTAWSALGSGLNGAAGALLAWNGSLIVGGEFTSAGGVPSNYIASWNGSAWQPMGAGLPAPVASLAEYGGQLFAGLSPANRYAGTPSLWRWNATQGAWQSVPGTPVGSVTFLGVDQGRLITSGWFVDAGGPGESTGGYVATWNQSCGPVCDDIDFNNDGSRFDPVDLDAFFSVFSEGPCLPTGSACNDIDFNNDSSVFDPDDIDAFLSVFSEGPCL